MKIVIAIDSFKGSMTSFEAGTAAAKGFQNQFPHAEIVVKPIADGGEGTVEALVEGLRGKYCQAQVQDPLSRNILAQYGIIDKTAVIEISAAAGIALLKEEERNPKITSTYGVGQLIKDAILHGCRDFIIGIGGSATNDGGVGMLQALGFEFFDTHGNSIPRGAEGLSKIAHIHTHNALAQLKDCHFQINTVDRFINYVLHFFIRFRSFCRDRLGPIFFGICRNGGFYRSRFFAFIGNVCMTV